MRPHAILAIDDDPVNLHIIQAIFEDDPEIALSVVQSGELAIEMLEDESKQFDVVLLDRMMPGISGMDVLQRIKVTPHLANTPIVMQTAAATLEEVREGLRAGAHYYLTKPYSPDALRTIVQTALEDIGRTRLRTAELQRPLDALRFTDGSSFSCRTLDEAGELAHLLAALCPMPGTALTGLLELLINAVEHGNLGITYAEKSQLKRDNRWREEVDRRAELPGVRRRRVQVEFERRKDALRFVIRDEGGGFAWRHYLEFDPARAFDPNGRGIALAKTVSFSQLQYEARGNVVVATVSVVPAAARVEPAL